MATSGRREKARRRLVPPFAPPVQRRKNCSCDSSDISCDDSVVDPDFCPDNESDSESNYIISEPDRHRDDAELPQENIVSANEVPIAAPDSEQRPRGRKRQRNESLWKCNVRKEQRTHGQQYINVKGTVFAEKHVKELGSAPHSCKFQCSDISTDDRKSFHRHFWSLSETKKCLFYGRYVKRDPKSRQRTKNNNSRRQYSYRYYVPVSVGPLARVCKKFFLGTLDISQRRISYFFEHIVDSVTGLPRSPLKGKHQKKVISVDKKDAVRAHINSIPRVSSHYCRASTSKEYFERGLNLNKLYDLYREERVNSGKSPVKAHMYREIFNKEFNIEFLKPKKDRCNKCEAFRMNENPSEEEKRVHALHMQDKHETYQERQQDREKSKTEEKSSKTAVVGFDLQNVIGLPRANVSCFFYKSKLNTYNETGHCSLDGRGYCCIWDETLSGRTGNDIASSLSVIVSNILATHQQVQHVIIWADSCVSQNRNSFIVIALRDIILNHENLLSIQMKYCTPGHSSIQEVDNIHSQIERSLMANEVFSPLGLRRVLLQVNRKKPLKILPMTSTSFKNYATVAKQVSSLRNIPFTKVKCLMISRDEINKVNYKTSFAEREWNVIPLLRSPSRVQREVGRNSAETAASENLERISTPKVMKTTATLTERKVKDIKSMLPYMSQVDRDFISAVLKKK